MHCIDLSFLLHCTCSFVCHEGLEGSHLVTLHKQQFFKSLYNYIFIYNTCSKNVVPLVARMCPSDTYKVYKQGSNVRIDTTLLGFDHSNWQRGDKSYIFKGQCEYLCNINLYIFFFFLTGNHKIIQKIACKSDSNANCCEMQPQLYIQTAAGR